MSAAREAGTVTGQVYVNYLVVKPENAEAEWLKALESVLATEKVQKFILENEQFAGGVIPTFEIAQ